MLQETVGQDRSACPHPAMWLLSLARGKPLLPGQPPLACPRENLFSCPRTTLSCQDNSLLLARSQTSHSCLGANLNLFPAERQKLPLAMQGEDISSQFPKTQSFFCDFGKQLLLDRTICLTMVFDVRHEHFPLVSMIISAQKFLF